MLFLTAKDQISDRVTGLNAGADDKLDTNEFLQASGDLKKRKVSNSNYVK